jgi:hypothetical protein
MSNPDPNLPPDLKRDSRRHIGPLLGMALVVIFGLGMAFWWLTEDVAQAPGPDATPGLTQEQAMEPPASPNEGGVQSGSPAAGSPPLSNDGTGGGVDAVGDPVPEEGSVLNPTND